jgi:hypothetical protein
MQLAASGVGECARTGGRTHGGRAEVGAAIESINETETYPMTGCWFTSPLLASGCETGIVFFLETAQQVLFAQQFGLQPSGLGVFERMQEAAGSCRGLTIIANAMANKIGPFRIANV